MTEDHVARHYGHADLSDRLLARLAEHGVTPETVTLDHLAALDQMHLRGREATLELGERLGLQTGMSVLDLGSGIGGPARLLAHSFQVVVTAVDLTPAFTEASAALTELIGLSDHVHAVTGDATETGLSSESFDRVVTLHATMNIPDKAAVYREAFRCLRPGGRFGFYDVTKGGGGAVLYPVPWAGEPAISHLLPANEMIGLCEAAGFHLIERRDLTEASRRRIDEQRREAQTRKSVGGRAPLQAGDILMGPDAADKQRNLRRNIEEGRVAITLALLRKPH